MANRNLPDPLVIPAKPLRLAEANAHVDNLIKTATQLEPPLPLLDTILPRMSNQQLRDELGLVDDREADNFRVDQATAFDTNPFIAGRLDAMLRNVRDGRITPDVDDNSNLFLNAVSSVFGGLKSGVGQAFKVIELYDRNVADPFAGGVTGLVQMLLPGEQEIERLIREKTDGGQNIWEAAGEAFDESGLPGWVKFGIQLGADPLVVAGAARLIAKGTLGAANAARLLDPGGELAFKGGRAVVKKATGKSKKKVIYHGTRTTKIDSFLNAKGDLVLNASSNFDGKQIGVSFTDDLKVAADYSSRTDSPSRAKGAGMVFEIDRDAIAPNLLKRQAADEIASVGGESVIIPKGKFRILIDDEASLALRKWETDRIQETSKLPDDQLIERNFAQADAIEIGEHERAFEDPFGGFGRPSPGIDVDIVASHGPVNPERFADFGELVERYKTNPTGVEQAILRSSGSRFMSPDDLLKDVKKSVGTIGRVKIPNLPTHTSLKQALIDGAPDVGGAAGIHGVSALTSTVAGLPDIDVATRGMGGAEQSRLKKLLGIFDPSSVHTPDTPEGMLIGHAKLEDLGRNFSEVSIASILANGDWNQLFKPLKGGKIKLLTGKEERWEDVWDAYGKVNHKNPMQFTDKQVAWLDDAHDVVRDADKMVAMAGATPLKVVPFLDEAGDLVGQDALTGINKFLNQSYSAAADKKLFRALRGAGLIADQASKTGKVVHRLGAKIENVKLADQIDESLKVGRLGNSELNPVRVIGQASDALRTIRASFDIGAPLIQGLPLLFRNPVIWGKAALAHIDAFRSPTKRARYIKDNADVVTEFINNGGIIGSTEFFEGLNNGGWLANVPGALRRQTFERANRSFDTFLDMSKIEFYKSMRATAATGDQLADLANHTNKMLGTISTAALGVGRTQRELERAIIMFSPRYTRASASLLIDAFKGGMRGQQARIAMGNLLVGGMITYRAFAEILEQEPNFDPTSGGFLKVNIHGVDVGIGGKFRSMARLYGKVFSEEQINSPQDFLKWNLFNKEDFNANPLAQWARSNGAPGAQVVLNMMIGENVLGKQIPDEDPADWLEFAGEEAPVPFFLQAGIESGTIGQRAIAAGAEFIGGTAFTPNETDILREIQDKASLEMFGLEWSKLAADQKLAVEGDNPDIEEQSLKANDQSSRFTRKREQVEYFQERDRVDGVWTEIVNNKAAEFDSDVDNPDRGRLFRENLSDENKIRRRQLQDLGENRYPDVIAGFEERDTGDKPVFDIALREYEDLIFSALDEFGNLDYNTPADPENEDPTKRLGGIDAREEMLRKKWGDKTINDIKQFIKDKKSARGDLSETVLQYFDAIEVIRPYWDIWKTTLKGQDLILWTAFEALGAGQQELIRNDRSSRGARFRLIESKVRVAKERFRAKNQEIDALLVKFWDLSPKHRQNILDKRRGL